MLYMTPYSYCMHLQARMLRSLQTLPKLMLPRFSLAGLRRQVFTAIMGKRLAAQTAGSLNTGNSGSSAAAPTPVADSPDAAAANASAFSSR
jgi:hypothetical protein